MKLVSERRSDFRPWFIRKVEAMLTEDREDVMLEINFGDEPDDIVGLFFGRDDEVFDARYIDPLCWSRRVHKSRTPSRVRISSPRLPELSAAILGAVP